MKLTIHGNANQGYILSDDSKSRADKAIELILQKIEENPHEEITLIITGGLFHPSQGGVAVSEAIRKYIQDIIFSKGIFIKIDIEPCSLTTIDHAERLSKDLIDGDMLITSDYHVIRTRLIWRLIGKKRLNVIGAKSMSEISLKNIIILIPKLIVETIGIVVTIAYWIGFKWPELYFRAKSRTV